MPRHDPLRDELAREALQRREADENATALTRAKATGKSVTFISHDGCEVTVTPDGHVFHNMADWF